MFTACLFSDRFFAPKHLKKQEKTKKAEISPKTTVIVILPPPAAYSSDDLMWKDDIN